MYGEVRRYGLEGLKHLLCQTICKHYNPSAAEGNGCNVGYVEINTGGNVTFDICPFFQEHSQGLQQGMGVIHCKTDCCL